MTGLLLALLLTPTIERTENAVRADLGNGTVLTFAVAGDRLLGLQTATVNGVALKSAETVQRPVLAQDLPADRDPMIWSGLRLKNVAVTGNAVEITCDLLGTTAPAAFREVYVFADDQIHRDAHRFPMLQQPENICRIEVLTNLPTTAAGTLVWRVEPDERNIAGWQWTGWKQSYRFTLADGRKVSAFRQLGTWELDGKTDGLTVVNLRYRGLGGVEQTFTADAAGKVHEAWSTIETLPGAVGKAPAISPVVPDSVAVNDRGFALRHRAGAWICRMARGAGVGFVDFQYRPHAALCSFFEKQGNLRAATEVYPGDRWVSQTDEEWFARTNAFTTQPQVYLALTAKQSRDEWRTRWQELDQYVRDLVSAELRFVQYEPLPGVGILSDNGWAGYYRNLAKSGIDGWAKMGVRLVAYHNPGWINGRYQGPKGDPETPPKTGGGVCLVYDWIPAKDIQQPWRDAMRRFATNKIAFYPWMGTYNWADAAFAHQIGTNRENWSVKADGITADDNAGVVAHNYLQPAMRQAWLDRLEHSRTNFGFQGFWVDSFQSTGMHRFTADEAHAPQQRITWELLAEWSRRGVGLMAESHAFPGMSCSIELTGWQDSYWFFPHVWRWYRGEEQKRFTPEQLDRLAFRFMANKSWTAPDKSYQVDAKTAIPSFERLAHEYLAALPAMRRPYVLGEERGMLWLPFDSDSEGVWFSFTAQPVPEGVTAAGILDAQTVTMTAAEHTYRVRANDLLARFGATRGPLPDPRRQMKYEPPRYTWPE